MKYTGLALLALLSLTSCKAPSKAEFTPEPFLQAPALLEPRIESVSEPDFKLEETMDEKCTVCGAESKEDCKCPDDCPSCGA